MGEGFCCYEGGLRSWSQNKFDEVDMILKNRVYTGRFLKRMATTLILGTTCFRLGILESSKQI